MATITRGYTFGATETVTNTKLHSLVDSATISGIVAADIASGAITGPKIAMGSDAQGDILYHNGTNYARLAAGTAGQALTTGGASANPAWAGMTTRGDLEYRGATTRTRLAVGTANQVVRSDGTDPAWASVTTLLDNLFSSSQGAVLYRGATAWAALAPGTSGQFLKTQGAAANPVWDSAGFTAATQAEMEAASSTTVGVTPGRHHFHPSSAKVWVVGLNTTIDASYNVSSLTDNGVGDWTVNFTTGLSSANYAYSATARSGGDNCCSVKNLASGNCTVTCFNTAGAAADPSTFSNIIFGDI